MVWNCREVKATHMTSILVTHCLDSELHISAILPTKPYLNLLNVPWGLTHKSPCKTGERSERV